MSRFAESDALWREDRDKNGWEMPKTATWQRLPVIRHIRAAIAYERAYKFRQLTRSVGLGIGGIPQGDRWVVYGIARGFK